MKQIFDDLSQEMSRVTTQRYSTSFSLGIRFLNSDLHKPIYSIYGFVRFADEIVDTFHGFDKTKLLADFKAQTYQSIEDGISLNPILNSFQWAVNTFNIPLELIETFLKSMEMDLDNSTYDKYGYEEYILGSAEVIGLMCLKVFVEGDESEYERLKPLAMKLGSAFQKINFLRDLKADYHDLGRTYFPGIDLNEFNSRVKQEIEEDIESDFKLGYEGIKQLPKKARFGVYVAYIYYYKLFNKIKGTAAHTILNERIRIPNNKKLRILLSSYVRHNLNLL
ncbi:MAG: phytoene/squalene synthase family protein [Crocinitomicaceae bacterium]|jgi:phytoene/squalene synthetase|nr:phytoene/squalene synthase family protein [Crocinitomicaceae bacterium]MCF8444316.1 phytoene/squalene synthase family protein [Crocinitomicaceae bacterium]